MQVLLRDGATLHDNQRLTNSLRQDLSFFFRRGIHRGWRCAHCRNAFVFAPCCLHFLIYILSFHRFLSCYFQPKVPKPMEQSKKSVTPLIPIQSLFSSGDFCHFVGQTMQVAHFFLHLYFLDPWPSGRHFHSDKVFAPSKRQYYIPHDEIRFLSRRILVSFGRSRCNFVERRAILLRNSCMPQIHTNTAFLEEMMAFLFTNMFILTVQF